MQQLLCLVTLTRLEYCFNLGSWPYIHILYSLDTEIEVDQRKLKEEKEAEKRKKTVIVGDMEPLMSALPVPTTR